MRLALSNLAFPGEERERTYAWLASLGVDGIEVAPTRLAPWDEATDAVGRSEARLLADAGLAASSLQAVFFGLPECQLLQDEQRFQAMREQVVRLGGFADAIGAKVAVFGAPGNRARGALSPDDATTLGMERLRALGEALAGSGLVLGMEPVPAYYKGDFLTTAEEVEAMVRAVDHPKIGLHLDTGCVMLGGGDIERAIASGADIQVHMHAAEPDLGPFASPRSPHVAAARALDRSGYDRWLAIEMREDPADPLAAIAAAVGYVRQTYFAAA